MRWILWGHITDSDLMCLALPGLHCDVRRHCQYSCEEHAADGYNQAIFHHCTYARSARPVVLIDRRRDLRVQQLAERWQCF